MNDVFVSTISCLICMACSIFLIDHAWTYQPHVARNQLTRIPGLASRMAILMDLYGIPTAPEMQEQSNIEPKVQEQSNMEPKVQEQSNMEPKVQEQSNMEPKVQEQSNMEPKVQEQSHGSDDGTFEFEHCQLLITNHTQVWTTQMSLAMNWWTWFSRRCGSSTTLTQCQTQ